jgi:hypothetical protein
MIPYHRWIGLPHEFGADPVDGKGADCLILAHRVLLSAGIACPSIKNEWLELAKNREWGKLQIQWDLLMERIDKPEPYALSMSRNETTGFAIGVVIDKGLLFVHHRKGVAWVPLSLIKADFWRVRRAPV